MNTQATDADKLDDIWMVGTYACVISALQSYQLANASQKRVFLEKDGQHIASHVLCDQH